MSTTALADDVLAWLADLEKLVGESGWEQDHALWLCTTVPMGRDSNNKPITAVTFSKAPLPGIMDYRAGRYLLEFAAQLRAKDDFRQALLDVREDSGDLFAVAFSSESFSIPPQDAQGEWRHRNWAEHPERREARSILAVDIFGGRYSVFRHRDDDQMTIGHNRGGDKAQIRNLEGTVINGLGQILDALRTPPWLRR